MKLILQFANYNLELRERDSVSVQRQTASKLPPVCTLTSDSKDLAFNLMVQAPTQKNTWDTRYY